MAQTRTIRTEKLKPGEQVIEAYDKNENLLIRDFWVKNKEDIKRLRELGVNRVTVRDEEPSSGQTSPRKDPTHQRAPSPDELDKKLEAAPSLVRETRALYRHSVTKIKDIFFSADRSEDVDPKELTPFIEKIVGYSEDSPASIAVLTQIEDFDFDTFRHSVNMGILSILYARHRDYDDQELVELAYSAILHDIGKIQIPENIILKEGPLSEGEFDIIKTHATRGEKLLQELGMEEPITQVAREHHERPDGSGYPAKIKSIHPYSRIVSVFDVYDAMTSKRVYSEEVKPNRAFSILRNEFGTFSETRSILYDLLRCLGLYPVGCLVQLSGGELAIVQHNHPDDLKHPVLCVISDDSGQRLDSPFLLNLKRIQSHKTMKNGKFYDHGTKINNVLSIDEIPDFDGEDMYEALEITGMG